MIGVQLADNKEDREILINSSKYRFQVFLYTLSILMIGISVLVFYDILRDILALVDPQ